MHTVLSSDAVDRWPYAAKGVSGPHATTMSKDMMACRRQPDLRHGCQVHAVLSADAEVVEAVRKILQFVSMPIPWWLTLHAHIAYKLLT